MKTDLKNHLISMLDEIYPYASIYIDNLAAIHFLIMAKIIPTITSCTRPKCQSQ